MFNFLKKNATFSGSLFEWFDWKSGGKTAISVNEKSALQVTAVLCGIRVIGEGIAQMPCRIKRREIVNKRPVANDATDHPVYKLLNEKPNAWQTPFEFFETGSMLAALCGDFLAVKNVIRGEVKELLPVPNTAWTVKQNADYSLAYEITTAAGVIKRSEKEVFHLRGPSLDGFRGAAPIQIARKAIGLSLTLENNQAVLSERGGRPSGILASDTPLNDPQRKNIKDTWDEKFGSGGDGGIAVLDGPWKFSPMAMTAVDAQHLETRKHQIEEVARILRVYPQMLMQTDKASTFASAEQFFRAHVTHTLGPWICRWQDAIKRDLLSSKDDADVFADFDERIMLRGDFKDQADYYSKALGSGGSPAWFTQNDVRRDLGMSEIDDQAADQLPVITNAPVTLMTAPPAAE